MHMQAYELRTYYMWASKKRKTKQPVETKNLRMGLAQLLANPIRRFCPHNDLDLHQSQLIYLVSPHNATEALYCSILIDSHGAETDTMQHSYCLLCSPARVVEATQNCLC